MAQRTYSGLLHLNGNLLCALDTETTGFLPGFHDLIELAIVPLDENIEPHKRVMPLNFTIQPKRPENIDPAAMSVNKMSLLDIQINGTDPWKSAEAFEEWFEKLNLGPGKRLSPLAHNWPHDRGFLQDWLGPKTFDYIFDSRYRDTMVAALYDNDYADHRTEPYPYPKVNLNYLCNMCQVENTRAHRALEDALATSQCYRKMLEKRI